MKKLLSSFVFIATFTFSSSLLAQIAPAIEWEKSLGGSNTDEGFSIAKTIDNGFVIAGSSWSTNGDVTGNHGYDDYWITKLDSIGNIVWEKSFGGSDNDRPSSIQSTLDGGFIIAGLTRSTDGDVNGNHGDLDEWIIKLDGDGNLIWEKTLGGSGTDAANSIQQTSDGGYIVAGVTEGANDGDVSGWQVAYNYYGGALCDSWIVKLDSAGNIIWQKCFGGSDDDVSNSLIQNTDGSFTVAGYSLSTDGDVSGNHGGISTGDYWVFKIDAIGNLIWQKCLGGSADDIAFSMTQTLDEGYIICGSTGSNDGDVSGMHLNAYGNPTGDAWIVKLDKGGNVSWKKCIGGSHSDATFSVELTSDGGYVFSGSTDSNDGDVSGNHGSGDYWVVKINSVGEIEWQKCLGGNKQDNSFSIQQVNDGGYAVAGWSSSNNNDVNGNQGSSDYWVVKLSSDVTGISSIEKNAFSIYPNPVQS